MRLISSVLAFSIFSGSVLIGGNFYKYKNDNQNVTQLVYGNNKEASVVNFLKTNKDLGEISLYMRELGFDLQDTKGVLFYGQRRMGQITQLRNTHISQNQKLDGDIEKRDKKISALINSYSYALAKSKKHKEFKTSKTYINSKIKGLQKKIQYISKKIIENASKDRVKQMYEKRKAAKQQELENTKSKKINLEKDLKKYKDTRETVQVFIHKNKKDKSNFYTRKNGIQNYLLQGLRNKSKIEKLLQNSQFQIKNIEDTMKSLSQEKEKLSSIQETLKGVIIDS